LAFVDSHFTRPEIRL